MAAVVPPFYNFTGNYKPSGQDRTAAETELYLVAEIFSVEIKQKTSIKKYEIML